MKLVKCLYIIVLLFAGISEVKASDIPTIYITTADRTAFTTTVLYGTIVCYKTSSFLHE